MRQLETGHYPFDLETLPPSWAAVSVGEAMSEIQPGFPCGAHNKGGIGVPHIRPMNIDRAGRLDLGVVKYVSAEHEPRLRRGDVLFNNTNSAELIGKTTHIAADSEMAFSNHMTRLSPPAGVDPGFVAYQLHFLWMMGYFQHRCTHHVNQASVSSKTLADTVPLIIAPSAEQRRIVAEIEKQFTRLDAAVAALKLVQANLKRYRASVLKAACEGRLVPTEAELACREHRSYEPASVLLERILAERRSRWETKKSKSTYQPPAAPDLPHLPPVPEGWTWTTLDQLTALEPNAITDGPFGSNLKTEHYTTSGPRVIRLQNIGDGKFVDAEAHISNEHFKHLAKHEVKAGDIVIAALGGRPPRSCLIPPSVGPAIVKADCIRFKPGIQIALPEFLNIVLNAEPTQKRTSAIVHGVGRPRLNLGEIKSIAVPLPPLPEQTRITAETERRLSLLDEIMAEATADLIRSERLRQSILKRAFEGKLAPQDPTDEPASVVLERIRGTAIPGCAPSVPKRASHRNRQKAKETANA